MSTPVCGWCFKALTKPVTHYSHDAQGRVAKSEEVMESLSFPEIAEHTSACKLSRQVEHFKAWREGQTWGAAVRKAATEIIDQLMEDPRSFMDDENEEDGTYSPRSQNDEPAEQYQLYRNDHSHAVERAQLQRDRDSEATEVIRQFILEAMAASTAQIEDLTKVVEQNREAIVSRMRKKARQERDAAARARYDGMNDLVPGQAGEEDDRDGSAAWNNLQSRKRPDELNMKRKRRGGIV